MPSYTAPTRDLDFVLNEFLALDRFQNVPRFQDMTPDLVRAILEEGGKLAEEVLQPINASGDQQGCTWEDGKVTPPDGFEEAYKTFSENGWGALSSEVELGGQGLPGTIAMAFNELVSGANMAFGMYPGLTHAATSAIEMHGSEEQKHKFIPKMISGEWSGTMNLTEPHCGTDLGMMRTKAEPQADGSYKITGTKIFISAGEHDMSQNIIHLVLARLPDAPGGTQGISLFLVPKYKLDNDNNPTGERNGVSCGAIEHKMGIHGNATCVMNYEDAVGELLGEPNKGMKAMFTMMNEARLGVALQGVAISEAAYQNAAEYARERLQGRALTGPQNEDGPADPIIVHPDVRRMLMDARAFNEGARALLLESTLNSDIAMHHPDEEAREKAEDTLALLTPVLKGYFTDKGFQNAVNAQQVFGGHGYIAEQGMEQFVRDARISMIYEGANGIQALDLVGRKLPLKGGAPFVTWVEEARARANDLTDHADLGDGAKAQIEALARLEEAFAWFMENALQNFDHAGAGSVDFMYLFGLTALGDVWLRMGKQAAEQVASGNDDPFYANKIITAKYFFARMLPDTAAHLEKIKTGADPVMALAAEAF